MEKTESHDDIMEDIIELAVRQDMNPLLVWVVVKVRRGIRLPYFQVLTWIMEEKRKLT